MLKFIVDGKEVTENDARVIYQNKDRIKELEDELNKLHDGKNVEILIED